MCDEEWLSVNKLLKRVQNRLPQEVLFTAMMMREQGCLIKQQKRKGATIGAFTKMTAFFEDRKK